ARRTEATTYAFIPSTARPAAGPVRGHRPDHWQSRFNWSNTEELFRPMPELSVVVITADEEQRSLLQVLVDSTAVARMTHSFGIYPPADTDPLLRRIHDLKADVILVDLLPAMTAPALRAIEVLRVACVKPAVFAVGEMNKPQLIVDAMRAGAQEFL